MTNNSIIAAQSPELSGNISSSCCRVLLSITFRENTAADGMLALSLTCMIFLGEQCMCSALTVFSVFFLLVNDAVYPVQLILFLFLKHLLIVKNSKFKKSRFFSLITRGSAIFVLAENGNTRFQGQMCEN